MGMFFAGILVMYLISGIIIAISETFGDGVLDNWLFQLFCWWINLLILPIALIKKHRKIKKIQKRMQQKVD